MKRRILLFPKFNNQDLLDSIGAKYDPLAKLILPHISVGRLENEQDFSAVLAEIGEGKTLFSCSIEEVAVENVGEDESSTIEMIHHL